MNIRPQTAPWLTQDEIVSRMRNGESLRRGLGRDFGLWNLKNNPVAMLGDEILLTGNVDHTEPIDRAWLMGLIVESNPPDAPDGIDFYRLTSDAESKSRRDHIARWGVMDLEAADRLAARGEKA